MRYFKKTFIWIIALTVLAGYYFIDVKREKIREKEKDEATRLLPFEPNQVLKIQLRKSESDIELERWEQGWLIIKPVKAPALGQEVDKFLKYVTDSRNDSEYVMDTNPTEERLKEFGLDKPDVTVTLYVGRDLTPHTILFGNRAPTKGVAFARLMGDPKVYRVLADAKAEADQDVYYFRDKKIVDYNPEMVDQMQITTPSGVIHCELPMDGKWRIVKPISARADITQIMELLTVFKNKEIKEFIEEEPKDLVQYGLNPVTKKISFWVSGAGQPSGEIAFGKKDKKKRGVYARLNGKENVVLLEDKLLDYIPAEPFILMNKEVFFFEEEGVEKLRIFSGEAYRDFQKAPDYNWEQIHPERLPVDFNPIMAFLQKMKKMKIQKFISGDPALFQSSGLNKPSYKIMVWKKGVQSPELLVVGKNTDKGGYFAMSGAGQGILIINDQVITDVNAFLGEMK